MMITGRSRLVILSCITLQIVEMFTELEEQDWVDDHRFGYTNSMMLQIPQGRYKTSLKMAKPRFERRAEQVQGGQGKRKGHSGQWPQSMKQAKQTKSTSKMFPASIIFMIIMMVNNHGLLCIGY